MTDNDNDSVLPEDEKLSDVLTKAAPKETNIQKWGTVAVGVGSAALVAALMYGNLTRRKK